MEISHRRQGGGLGQYPRDKWKTGGLEGHRPGKQTTKNPHTNFSPNLYLLLLPPPPSQLTWSGVVNGVSGQSHMTGGNGRTPGGEGSLMLGSPSHSSSLAASALQPNRTPLSPLHTQVYFHKTNQKVSKWSVDGVEADLS